MGKRNREEFELSAIMNRYNYNVYYNRLKELATSMFEWVNLPDTCDERFLEMSLFDFGQAIFFKDEDIGYLGLRCATAGRFNVYNVPTQRRAYASNGYNRELDENNSVIIYNNYIRTNTAYDMKLFALRLWSIDRAIDVNANSQKTPILLHCTEQQRLTLENAYMQYTGNQPVIFADNSLDLKNFSVLKTDAPYVADKLYQLKTQIWNEALTFLGISNLNVTKKERLVTDEVIRNQGGTIASRYTRLEMRRQACEQINRMFGLDLDVRYREDYREAGDIMMLNGETGDEEATPLINPSKDRW